MQKKFPCWKNNTRRANEKIKPTAAYQILKYIGIFVLVWPLDKNIKWFYRLFYEMCWWILLMNEIFLFLGILIGFYYFSDKITRFTTVSFILIELTIIFENVYTVLVLKIRSSQVKTLISMMEKTANNAMSEEEILFRKYMKATSLITYTRWIIYHVMFVIFIYLNLFEPKLVLPEEVWHPFPMDPFNKKRLVFVQQLTYIIRSGALNIVDGLVNMSLNLATAKLNILSDEFKKVDTNFELKECIRQHQHILWYVTEISSAMRFIILKVIVATAFYLIYGFLQLVRAPGTLNPTLMLQFLILVLFASYRVYYIATCAEDLTSMGENLIFSLQWRGKSREMCTSMCIIIQRCQRPLYISVSGIMPQFSMKYYTSFLYLTFSYFLTLKTILESKIS